MGPLLALVAAALLARACALTTLADSDNALPSSYDGVCTTQVKGYKSKITIMLPAILIPAQQKEFALDIPDQCPEQGKQLIGGVVSACDADAPPRLSLPPTGAGAGALRRSGALRNTAHCYVKLYCI